MRTLTRAALALLLASSVTLPVLGQSGANRTGSGIPAPTSSGVAIAEGPAARQCRIHCGSLQATPNGKALPNIAVARAHREVCATKMLKNE